MSEEKIKRKHIKTVKILMILLAISAFMVSMSSEVKALENNVVPDINPDKELSLTIKYSYEIKGHTKYLKGAGFKLYRVADLTAKKGSAMYNPRKGFNFRGLSYEKMKATDSLKAALKFHKIVKERGISPTKKKTDKFGEATFTNLKPGMYLVYQDKTHKQLKHKYDSTPFLVSVPQIDRNGGKNRWEYSVTAMPKASSRNRLPGPKPPIHKPDTGDNVNLMFWGLMLIIADAGLVLLYLRRRKERL